MVDLSVEKEIKATEMLISKKSSLTVIERDMKDQSGGNDEI